jgi:hypothetical protein
MTHDGVEVVEFGAPAQHAADAIRCRDRYHDIAFASGAEPNGQRMADGAADRLDDLAHRIAAAIAAVERDAVAALAEITECGDVGAGEIADVDEIANAGAVRRRIVGAENVHAVPAAERLSTATLIRWVAPGVDRSVRSLGSAPATLK